jgi:hypothetical protein
VPGEQEVEDSAVGVLTDKMQESDYKTCPAMQEGVRKYLLTAYATQTQLNTWKISLESQKANERMACNQGANGDLFAGNWTPQKHFEKLTPTEWYYTYYKGSHYLHVLNDDASLKQDADLRIKAKIQVLYDGEGFYDFPLAFKPHQEVCDELSTPLMTPEVMSHWYAPVKPEQNVVPHPKSEPDPLLDEESGKSQKAE